MNKEVFVDGLKYTEEERLARDVRKMLDELTGGRREAYDELAEFYTEHHGVYSVDKLIDMAALKSGGERDAEEVISGLFGVAFRFYANRAQRHGLIDKDKLSDLEERLFGGSVP